MMNILQLCYILTICFTLHKLAHCEPKFPCYFVFGDSVVDNGNNVPRNTTAKVNYLPYGVDFPQGPTGRFTNGRNIADFLAEMLGFDKPIPPYANCTKEDFVRGVNYASGGSGIQAETGRATFGDVISFGQQLINHRAVVRHLTKQLGGKALADQHLGRCIYTVNMGSNDYLSGYLPQYYSRKTPHNPSQYAKLLIARYAGHLQKLYSLGARKIAVFGVGKLGCTPQEVAKYGATEGSVCVETSNDVTRVYNEQLKGLLSNLNERFNGANFVYTGSSNSTYDNITNLSDPCCKLAYGHCLPGASYCSNRNEYIFWDEVHPTEATYSYEAKSAFASMSPLYTDGKFKSI